MSYYIAQFVSPGRIVMVIYVALLKAHQNEGRALVTQALDLIAPVLPDRLTRAPDSKDKDRVPVEKVPMWAKLAKRVISDESSNLQQLISVLQFMIRHSELFYEARDQFIPQIIPALPKIAQPPSPSNDNRKLVLNVIEMIKNWEVRRISERDGTSPDFTGQKRLTDASPVNTFPAKPMDNVRPGSASQYTIQTSLRANTIKYLAQLMSTMVERYPVTSANLRKYNPQTAAMPVPSNETCKKAFGLFFDLLSLGYWTDLEVDLFPRMTEAVLASERTDKDDDKTVTAVVNTLQLVRMILNTKSDEWIQNNIMLIQKLLHKPLRSENMEIQDCLHSQNLGLDNGRQIRPLVRRVIEAIPEQTGDEDEMQVDNAGTEFIKSLSAIATETMAAHNDIAGIHILWTISQVRPANIDAHVQSILKPMSAKLLKDHGIVIPQQQIPGQGEIRPQIPVIDPVNVEVTIQLLSKAIDIVALRMNNLGDSRRPFLTVLASIVERSPSTKLCEKVISMVDDWMFNSTDSFPTMKEKTAVLHKMCAFEMRPDHTLLNKFLDLVIRIYENPKITRTEVTVRLETAFLIGCRASDVAVKESFMTIFDKSLTRTAGSRLLYVLTSQNWDTLADSFWLSQAMQLMLGSVEMGAVARLHGDDIRMLQPIELFSSNLDGRADDLIIDDSFEQLIAAHKRFNASLGDVRLRDLLEPLCQLQHSDAKVASELWSSLFPIFWVSLTRDERTELEKGMVGLLTKEYNQKQIDKRPNVVQALVDGAVRAQPKMKIPPHVLKFVSKTYDAWYPAMRYMEEAAIHPLIDTPTVRESNLDALVELYANLTEEDLFYGTWRRRCKFVETNAALSRHVRAGSDQGPHRSRPILTRGIHALGGSLGSVCPEAAAMGRPE